MRTPQQRQLMKDMEDARRKLAGLMAEAKKEKVFIVDRAPELPQALIEKCRLVRNRHDMIDLLPKNGVIAEIGTDRGAFAREMLAKCTPQTLHIFELDISRIHAPNIDAALRAGQVEIHEGDSFENMSAMPDGTFDWIYIDGDHSYEGVLRDITASLPKVKEGGLLVFNDYATWSPMSMSRCGVAKAVNEFCIKHNWEFVYLAFQSMMYNDVTVRKVG